MKHQNGLMMLQKGRLSWQVSGALVVTVPPPPPLPPSDLPHTIPGKIKYFLTFHLKKEIIEYSKEIMLFYHVVIAHST